MNEKILVAVWLGKRCGLAPTPNTTTETPVAFMLGGVNPQNVQEFMRALHEGGNFPTHFFIEGDNLFLFGRG